MNLIAHIIRILQIQFILFKYALYELPFETPSMRPLRLLAFFLKLLPFRRESLSRAQRIRRALEELGPIFVKFGQCLSTRSDLLPKDILEELGKLQDQVPPFCGKQARKMIEQSIGLSIEEAFQTFDETPLASASIAQVHQATLKEGNEVVVKVLRPNIRKKIVCDLALLKKLAHWTEHYWHAGRQFKPKALVAEFERTLLDELDLMREAANASQLRRNFSNGSQLYVPLVFWQYCKQDVLVIERIHGIPIHQQTLLQQQGFDLKQLAELTIEIFFTQVFRDRYFHADMHPGNIFVSRDKASNSPRLTVVDFGIMGSLSAKDSRYLAENFLAIIHRDYRRVAELHKLSGWIPAHIRIDEFESNIRLVCEPIFEKPLKDISLATLLIRLFETARRFQINIQPELILLQKTLFNIEGLSRMLYPDLDLFKTARPFFEQWMKDRSGAYAFIKKFKHSIPYWIDKLPEIPELLHSTLEKLTQTDHTIMQETNMAAHLKTSKSELYFGIMIGMGIVSLFMLLKGFF